MSKYRVKAFIIVAVVLAAALFFMNRTGPGESSNAIIIRKIKPVTGSIRVIISTTGVVEPQNRLEIKPPIDGRIEEITVNEGDPVTQGQILAWMSSIERATLLDAARAQGKEAVEYWKDVYKATPLMSPIDGEVIVRAVEPGQTADSSTAVIVLSDRLIVSAQIDETDIGRVRIGQKAIVSLDAYPHEGVKGIVDHIAYESEIVNNVTIYEVDIVPEELPDFFRSGMSANVDIVEKEKKDILLLPIEAVSTGEGKNYVLTTGPKGRKSVKTEVGLGLTDDTNFEIISGLSKDDLVIIKKIGRMPPRKKSGSNPFMPFGTKKNK